MKLSIAAQRYPFCAKAFVEFLHLLNEPRIEVSLKEMEMSSVIDEVAQQVCDVGIIFVSDMTEHYIHRILKAKNLEFRELVKVRREERAQREEKRATDQLAAAKASAEASASSTSTIEGLL